jgi:hypothetical protein
MITLKSPHSLCFLIFLILLPCILFGALAEFARDIKEIDARSSAGLSGETAETSVSDEPGGTAFFISENPPLYSQPLTQSRVQLNRLWRQFLALIICALLLKSFSKVMLLKYCLHYYFPRVFFHSLLISLLLGGRAPPRSIYQPGL